MLWKTRESEAASAQTASPLHSPALANTVTLYILLQFRLFFADSKKTRKKFDEKKKFFFVGPVEGEREALLTLWH